MANEVVRDADATYTELERRIIVEARARVVAYPLCMVDSLEGLPTLVKDYSKHPVTADAGAITDGTALSNTAVNPTKVTGTTAAVGLATDVTDQSSLGSLLDVPEVAANFSRALTNKMEVDITALYASFATVVGTSGSDLTIGNWLTSIYNLELNNEDNDIFAVIHPIQLQDLRSAVVSSSAGIFGNPQEFTGGLAASINRGAVKGSFLGVPTFSSSTVPTANAGADRAGGMFSRGRALYFLWKWGPRIETIRAPKLPGTSIALTACYTVFEAVDLAGVALITDA